MPCRRFIPLWLALGATLLPAPEPARGQTSGYDIDRDIAEYEDTLRKVRDEKWLYLPIPGAGGLISREQEVNLFSHLILTGQMSPDSVAARHRQYREGTRYLQTTIEVILRDLYRERDMRDGKIPRPPEPVTAPDRVRGTVTGEWSVPCVVSDTRAVESGTFTLTFGGDGSVGGRYASSSGGFGVSGNVDPAGNVQGTGAHPNGGFTWTARVSVAGGLLAMAGGAVYFSPNDPDVSCSAGTLVPTGTST